MPAQRGCLSIPQEPCFPAVQELWLEWSHPGAGSKAQISQCETPTEPGAESLPLEHVQQERGQLESWGKPDSK